MEHQSRGWRFWLAAAGLALAIFSVIWFALAALGTKWGWWDYSFGLGTMTIAVGPLIAMAAAGVSLIAIIAGLTKAPRTRPFILGLAGLLIGGMVFGRLGAFGAQAGKVPPIHDIQTNWENPVAFSAALMAAREAGGAENPVLDAPTIKVPERFQDAMGELDGMLVSVVQEAAEFDPDTMKDPDDAPYAAQIDTVTIDAAPADVFAVASRVVAARGWDVVTSDADAGVIEATEESGWYGFKDDVAVRLRAGEEGATLIDMRSTSRVGLSDLGANAKRIDEFLRDVKREAEAT